MSNNLSPLTGMDIIHQRDNHRFVPTSHIDTNRYHHSSTTVLLPTNTEQNLSLNYT